MTESQTDSAESLKQLVKQLESEDGLARGDAREKLVKLGGHEVTRALIFELNDPRRNVRWEAAKALISIADPTAAPALVQHLNDEDEDIRWLAAEGLGRLGDAGLLATLNATIRNSSDGEFCAAAHHAFKEFAKHGTHAEAMQSVLRAFASAEPGVAIPVAAFEAIREIKC